MTSTPHQGILFCSLHSSHPEKQKTSNPHDASLWVEVGSLPFFESTEQLKEVFERFWTEAKKDTEVMQKLEKSAVIVRFDIEQPEIHVTINFKEAGADGSLGTLGFESDVEPEGGRGAWPVRHRTRSPRYRSCRRSPDVGVRSIERSGALGTRPGHLRTAPAPPGSRGGR